MAAGGGALSGRGLTPHTISNDTGQFLEGRLVLVLLLLAGNRQPDNNLTRMAAAAVAASSRTARHVRVRTGRVHTAGLQLGEDLGEEARLGVDPQHVGRQPVHDQEASGSRGR